MRASGSSRGFWFQDPNPDNDPATSEGVFVFGAPSVAVGDSVLVSGKVSDFYPLAQGDTVAATSNLSVTEIGTATTIGAQPWQRRCPQPVQLTPTTVPDQYAPDLGGGNIEKTPITLTRSALDFYESVEGMRVEVDDARVVGPSDSFGEQYVTTKPNQDRTYRGGTELLAENATPSGRLEVVAADGSNPQVNVGDVFTGATVGPIDYSRFGGYELVATTLGHGATGQPRADRGHAGQEQAAVGGDVQRREPRADRPAEQVRAAGAGRGHQPRLAGHRRGRGGTGQRRRGRRRPGGRRRNADQS